MTILKASVHQLH